MSEHKNSAVGPAYTVGDRVQVKPGMEHDASMADKKGEIVEITTPALGVKFDGMPMVHHWHTDSLDSFQSNDNDRRHGDVGGVHNGHTLGVRITCDVHGEGHQR